MYFYEHNYIFFAAGEFNRDHVKVLATLEVQEDDMTWTEGTLYEFKDISSAVVLELQPDSHGDCVYEGLGGDYTFCDGALRDGDGDEIRFRAFKFVRIVGPVPPVPQSDVDIVAVGGKRPRPSEIAAAAALAASRAGEVAVTLEVASQDGRLPVGSRVTAQFGREWYRGKIVSYKTIGEEVKAHVSFDDETVCDVPVLPKVFRRLVNPPAAAAATPDAVLAADPPGAAALAAAPVQQNAVLSPAANPLGESS